MSGISCMSMRAATFCGKGSKDEKEILKIPFTPDLESLLDNKKGMVSNGVVFQYSNTVRINVYKNTLGKLHEDGGVNGKVNENGWKVTRCMGVIGINKYIYVWIKKLVIGKSQNCK